MVECNSGVGRAVRGRAGEALLIECSVIAMEGNEQEASSAEVPSSVVEATALRAHELKSLAERLGIKRRIAQDNNFHSMEIPLSCLSEYAGDLNFVIPDITEQKNRGYDKSSALRGAFTIEKHPGKCEEPCGDVAERAFAYKQ